METGEGVGSVSRQNEKGADEECAIEDSSMHKDMSEVDIEDTQLTVTEKVMPPELGTSE